MKGLKILLFACFTVVFSLPMVGQDIHFSLFHMSPLTLNPAQTGAFNGTARIGGIYRDQWGSVINDQFTTPSFYIDAPVIRGFGKYDWVGGGLVSYTDKVGTLELGTSAFLFSASYHRSLSKKNGDHILTLGVQGGQVSRQLKTDEIRLGNAVDFSQPEIPTGTSFDAGLGSSSSELKRGFFDINAGLMLNSKLDDENRLQLGVAVHHIPRGKYGLISSIDSDDSKRPMLIAAHGRFDHDFNEKWSITPGFLFRTTEGTPPEVIVQSWAGRQINEEFKLNFGAAYRFSDAAQVLVGLDYLEDIRVALSYDINVSSLNTVSNYQGGFELSAYYIIRIYKKPDITPALLCPQF